MADVFLSYSRKDNNQALELAERLRAGGTSVWIDQHGIEGASSWSGEIVRAINQCSALIVLLSHSSIESDNVTREVALAYEKKKRILPIELHTIELPEMMEYPLAGIQRLAYSNTEAIDRALLKIIGDKPVPAPEPITPQERPADPLGRKTIAVLPFENLSSDPDNEWFADGLTQELIGLISKLPSLHVTDRRSIMAYKNTAKSVKAIAQELGVEFIIEGTVRKAGPNLRITSELVEAQTGKHVWSETFKGTIDDIFEIQESVAKNIADGLGLALKPKEVVSLNKPITTNTEAYELYLRAREYGYSKDEIKSIPMLERAIELDPNFGRAYTALSSVYNRARSRYPGFGEKAYEYALKAFTIDPESPYANVSMGAALFNMGKAEQAYPYLLRAYQTDKNPGSASWMGFYNRNLKNFPEAARYYEEALEMEPGQPHFMMHLLSIYSNMNDTAALEDLAKRGLPHLELRLRTNHDHEAADLVYIGLLPHAGRAEEAIPAIKKLKPETMENPFEIYDLACTAARVSVPYGIELLRLAVAKGFDDLKTLQSDPDIVYLRESPEFAEIIKELEGKQ
jgi:adenylate cyclase